MRAGMLRSQLATLEPPAADERHVALTIDAAPSALADRALSALGLSVRAA